VGYTELLGNSDVNTKQSYFVKNIKTSSEYITQLVQDLLDFSQIEAGKITIEKVPFSLPEVINDVAKNIQSVYKQKNIELVITIDEPLNKRIVGDPFRMKQILSNLIGNAYKFTKKGYIKINAYQGTDDTFFIVSIQDSGIGIAKEDQKIVFEEFAQANENIEKKYGGTGLGLAICQKIISILGGKLNLESEFGKGSTFTIKLPLHFDTSFTIVPEIKKPIILNTNSYTFIVIDDDVNLLNLTSNVLKQEKHHVFSFDSAIKALQAIETIDFDFIITDIQMPVMDGFLFIEKLKNANYSTYKSQPIIALTGRADLDYSVFIEAGFTTVIKKPYSPKVLLETIQHILENNDIPAIKINDTPEIKVLKLYSTEPLKQFIGQDKEALHDILKQFIKSSEENMGYLENAISNKNTTEINSIAHRMAPMFRQIEAYQIDEILKKLEKNNFENSELENIFGSLTEKTNELFTALNVEIV
jgi:CheY-like chemotaxis protein/HPt (histidine-containing phosphotransfer) domain-containing protein